ncbi:MAG: family 43 glycosylhydrolase [Candidatus Glassbacteria bacterium]|nr:family 43 glycosylhydrolase [Candidatus Glassbacteria bacterium]
MATGGWRRIELGHPMPDPFCMRWGDAWYITGTHHGAHGGSNGLLYDMYRSADLRSWTHLGGILRRPQYEGSGRANYWAPEIMARDGKFYLYYTADSNGDNYKRYVRLGIAERIEGPYLDQGVRLTAQTSIDANPNWTDDGGGWMFFTGNEGNEHVGQVLVDRLVSPTETAGEPRKAFPGETVGWEEGAFLVPYAGRYFLFTSMGNWRDGSYHVLLSVSDRPEGPFTRLTDGDKPLVILRSHGSQLGTGHNSVFDGPDDRLVICYHAWDPEHTGRYPCFAPLRFDGERFHVEL